jgi:DNA-binding CsgD family transcriptional regulator
MNPSALLRDAETTRSDDPARLRDAALDVARRGPGATPQCPRAFWNALLEGRWRLIERFDAGGKRFTIARPVRAVSVAPRLPTREREVLERASLDVPLWYVAEQLGLAESTASETLTRALTRLGLRSRAQLVELRQALASGDDGSR